MRVGAVSFFYSDARAGLIDRALELALVFKCSPVDFLALDEDQLGALYARAVVVVNEAGGGED